MFYLLRLCLPVLHSGNYILGGQYTQCCHVFQTLFLQP